MLGKEVFILTMDEKGQMFAREAGFRLKSLPKGRASAGLSDVKVRRRPVPAAQASAAGAFTGAVNEIKNIAQKLVPAKISRTISGAQTPREPKVKVTETFFPAEFEPRRKSRGGNKMVTAIVAASLILVLLLVFVILPKATVVVYAKTEPVTRDMEISMSPNLTVVDVAKLTMPATKVDESASVSDKFTDNGKKQVGNKASGSVKIYNFTKLPINLKAATTVLAVGSKTYSLAQDVSGIRPTTYKNPRTKEVDETSLGDSVDIIATAGGEDFNLPAGTRLEITNQVFGSKPQLLYAKTDTEITGGTTRYLSVISQDDITAARNALQDKAVAQVRDKLGALGLVLADHAFNFGAPQFSTDNPAGAETPGFNATLQVKITGVAFKKDDLNNLIDQRIEQTIAADKTLQKPSTQTASYKVKSMDPNTLVTVLEAHYEGRAVFNLDLPNLAPELVGKSQNQVNEILQSKAEIDRVDITLAPAWQKNFPLFAGKIKVLVGDPSSAPN